MNAIKPTGKTIQRFIAVNMTGFQGGEAAAVKLAQTTDVLSAQANQLQQFLPAMRKANPNLVVLAYSNAAFDHRDTLDKSFYLLDASGNRIKSSGWGNYLINPANHNWQQLRVSEIRAMLQLGYDGVMIDMEGPAPMGAHYLTAPAINPTTTKPYSSVQEWLVSTSSFGRAIKNALGAAMVVPNGLEAGPVYFGGANAILQGVDGALAESWCEKVPTVDAWKQHVQMLIDADNQGKAVMAMVKTWHTTDQAQILRAHHFSLASFLCGAGALSFYEFSPSNDPQGIDIDFPEEHLDLGKPTGPYSFQGAVAVRTFEKGAAIVNPGMTQVVATLAHPGTNLAGGHGSMVTLGPQSGEVIVFDITPPAQIDADKLLVDVQTTAADVAALDAAEHAGTATPDQVAKVGQDIATEQTDETKLAGDK